MTRISHIDTHPFTLALKGSLSWGKASRLETLEHVLVRVYTEAGALGVAEAPVRPSIYGETVESVNAIIAQQLAPKLIGLAVNDHGTMAEVLASVANNHTAKGALDIALHQARAIDQGSTLFAVTRGPQDRIRISFILGMAELETMLEEARRVVAQGVYMFKVKVGRDHAHDARVLGALRHEFAGTPVTLYADANEGMDPDTAAKALEQLARLGVAYVEEPLPVEFVKARAALKKEQILPIIADDACFGVRDLRRELELDTFDILNIKPARTGYSESARMLALARAADKGVMVGSQASSSLGTLHCALFASQTGVTHPSELSFPLKLEEDVLEEKLMFREGYLDVADLPEQRLKRAFLG